ncbi:MAG: hypothetical protein ACXVRJ_03680 [Gaiellaceae bacterium]
MLPGWLKTMAAVGGVALATLVLAASTTAAAPPASFSGDGIAYDLAGTFTIDHFELKTPVAVAGPRRLVAFGTTTAVKTPAFGPGVQAFDDVPFAWVDVSVSATCHAAVVVSLGSIGGDDYVSFVGGAPIYDASVPVPPWDSSAHWEIGATSVTLPAARGQSCAIARSS